MKHFCSYCGVETDNRHVNLADEDETPNWVPICDVCYETEGYAQEDEEENRESQEEEERENAAYAPIDPPLFYHAHWKGWNDFLGVDPQSPDGLANIEQDKLDELRLRKRGIISQLHERR